MDVTENSEVDDEIKNIDDKSEDDRRNSDVGGFQDDNCDVKMESAENKGQVSLFMSL
jgi:hypothetical protein